MRKSLAVLAFSACLLVWTCSAASSAEAERGSPELDSISLHVDTHKVVSEVKNLWKQHAEKHKLYRKMGKVHSRVPKASKAKHHKERAHKAAVRLEKKQKLLAAHNPLRGAAFKALYAQLNALRSTSPHLSKRDRATVKRAISKAKRAIKSWRRSLAKHRLSLSRHHSVSKAIAAKVAKLSKLVSWAAHRKRVKAAASSSSLILQEKLHKGVLRRRRARHREQKSKRKQRLLARKHRKEVRQKRVAIQRKARKARRRAARKVLAKKEMARKQKLFKARASRARKRAQALIRKARHITRVARRKARHQRIMREKAALRLAIAAKAAAKRKARQAHTAYRVLYRKTPSSSRSSSVALKKLKRAAAVASAAYKSTAQKVRKLIKLKYTKRKLRAQKRIKRMKKRLIRLTNRKMAAKSGKAKKVFQKALRRVKQRMKRVAARAKRRQIHHAIVIKKKVIKAKKAATKAHKLRKALRHKLKKKWIATKQKQANLAKKVKALMKQKTKAKGAALTKIKTKLKVLKRKLHKTKRKEESKAFKYWKRVYEDTKKRITKTKTAIGAAKGVRKVMIQHELDALKTLEKMSHRAVYTFVSAAGLKKIKAAEARALHQAYLKSLNTTLVRKNKRRKWKKCKDKTYARGVCRVQSDDRVSTYFRKSVNNTKLGTRRDKRLPEVEGEWKLYENSCSYAKEQIHMLTTRLHGDTEAPLPLTSAVGYEEGNASFYFGITFSGNWKHRTRRNVLGVEFWKNGHKVKKGLYKTSFAAGNLKWEPDVSEDWVFSALVTNVVTKTKLHIKVYGAGSKRKLGVPPHMTVTVNGNKNGLISGLCADNTFMAPVPRAFSMFPSHWNKGRKPLALQASLLWKVKRQRVKRRNRLLKHPTARATKLLKLARAAKVSTQRTLTTAKATNAPFAAALAKAKTAVTSALAQVAKLAKNPKSSAKAKAAAAATLKTAKAAAAAAARKASASTLALKKATNAYTAASSSVRAAKAMLLEAVKASKALATFKTSKAVLSLQRKQKGCKKAWATYHSSLLEKNRKLALAACKSYRVDRHRMHLKLGAKCHHWRLHNRKPACFVHREFAKMFMPRWQLLRWEKAKCEHMRLTYLKSKSSKNRAKKNALCKAYRKARRHTRKKLRLACPTKIGNSTKIVLAISKSKRACTVLKKFDNVFAHRFVHAEKSWSSLSVRHTKCRLAQHIVKTLKITAVQNNSTRGRVLFRATRTAAKKQARRVCHRYNSRRAKRLRKLKRKCAMSTAKAWKTAKTRECKILRLFLRKFRKASTHHKKTHEKKTQNHSLMKTHAAHKAKKAVKKALKKLIHQVNHAKAHKKAALKKIHTRNKRKHKHKHKRSKLHRRH